MYWYSSQDLEFSSEHERVLESIEIGYESGPGTILHDFKTLLGYISENKLLVTNRQQLPMGALPEINTRFARPIEHGFKRPQQKSFPHIHGLYLVVRSSGLATVGGSGSNPILIIAEEVFQSWQSLNPSEQYFTLLESWLLRGLPGIVLERGRRGYRVPDNFQGSTLFFTRIPDEGLQVAGDREAEKNLPFSPGWHNLGLLDLFGIIDIRRGSPVSGKGWPIEDIERTSFGKALLALLHSEFFGDLDNIFELEEEEDYPFGILQPALRPYFPEWQNNLSRPDWAFREGVHIFKVSLGRIWRRIAVSAAYSLDDFASMILNAVKFDHDHLYSFSYQNRYGAFAEVYHPYMDEGPWASKVLVGDVPLRIGQSMTYLYDFGDNWEFDVTLEQVDPDMDIDKPFIIESHGESPEQYPTWDE